VGFPRTGLLTSTSSLAAASAWRDVADSLASPMHSASATSSSVRDEPIFTRCIAVIARAHRAVTASSPLLLGRSGRHALDETGASRTTRASTTRLVGDIAVKNLRIVALAVLLLNFHEVRVLRLCSTGVTM
jgi:hypothetical protein